VSSLISSQNQLILTLESESELNLPGFSSLLSSQLTRLVRVIAISNPNLTRETTSQIQEPDTNNSQSVRVKGGDED
jgi:hypothetical protein